MRTNKMQLSIKSTLALVLMESRIILVLWFSAMFIEEWKEIINFNLIYRGVASGIDANGFKRILAIKSLKKSFKKSSSKLCDALASNAFNSLNRAAALHNVRVIFLAIAIYLINTYRAPARLFVVGGEELESSEGTTQGDPLVMSLYAFLNVLIGKKFSPKVWHGLNTLVSLKIREIS